MTFLRCFTLATALFLSPLATPHHVVFEEIKEIETAIKQFDMLRKLFDAAARKARSHHHQLLLHHPSDLLQIETSYVHDGHDVHL